PLDAPDGYTRAAGAQAARLLEQLALLQARQHGWTRRCACDLDDVVLRIVTAITLLLCLCIVVVGGLALFFVAHCFVVTCCCLFAVAHRCLPWLDQKYDQPDREGQHDGHGGHGNAAASDRRQRETDIG